MGNIRLVPKTKEVICQYCGEEFEVELIIGESELLDGYHGECPKPHCGFWYFEENVTEDTQRELIESWYRLSNLAAQHMNESIRFQKKCAEYYGIEWHDLKLLEDNDRIIDTIDYGIDSLTFKEFDELVQSAIKHGAEMGHE